MKRILAFGLSLLFLITLVSCQSKQVSLDNQAVSKDEKFGAAFINLSQKEFENIGFNLGDSCSITFQNGITYNDVPYYNGYYVKNGEPVIVAYPGDPSVRITLNNMGIWDSADLNEGDKVTIKLETAGKYKAIQEALGQQYSVIRTDYTSDEEFCNFRELGGGKLKEHFLYRGASPVDNSRNRAKYVDTLLNKNGIKFVVDLADSEEDMTNYINSSDFSSNYAKALYESGSIVLLDMGSAYTSQIYKEKVVVGLRAALSSNGPFYIHCMEGKDRTGFVCMLIEALAEVSYDEMVADYMITYDNYFGVTESDTKNKYDGIVDLYFVTFMEFLHGTSDLQVLKLANYKEDAIKYLKDGGMTESEIESFITLITK